MSHAIHHDSPETIHYPLPDQRIKRGTATLGLGVICIVLAATTAALGLKLYKDNIVLTDLRMQLDRATSETTDLKTSLAKTDATATDLRSQLNQAKQQQTELQAQVKKSQELGSGLQTQLDQTRAELQSQHEKDQAQACDLQAQLSRANESSTAQGTELAAAKKQIADLQAQLAKAQDESAKAQTAATKARPLPLATDFKKGFWGSGFTLEIKNQGADQLKLDIQITGSPKTASRSATIEGGGTLKVEDIAAGAKVAIASDGFEPVALTAQ